MEVTIVIDDKMLELPVRDAVAKAVNEVIRFQVNKKLSMMQTEIESGVQKYLDRTLTSDVLKFKIDESVKELLRDRLEE